MKEDRLDPPRQEWESAQYDDDPFALGEIDETKLKVVSKNFLPRPEELVFKNSKPTTKKVTIVLDEFTIDTFKSKAQELGGSYQAMIRKLLYEYARNLKGEDHSVNT